MIVFLENNNIQCEEREMNMFSENLSQYHNFTNNFIYINVCTFHVAVTSIYVNRCLITSFCVKTVSSV